MQITGEQMKSSNEFAFFVLAGSVSLSLSLNYNVL